MENRQFYTVRIIRQSTGMIETRIIASTSAINASRAALRLRNGFRVWSVAISTAGEIEHRFNTLADQGVISHDDAQRIIDRALANEART